MTDDGFERLRALSHQLAEEAAKTRAAHIALLDDEEWCARQNPADLARFRAIVAGKRPPCELRMRRAPTNCPTTRSRDPFAHLSPEIRQKAAEAAEAAGRAVVILTGWLSEPDRCAELGPERVEVYRVIREQLKAGRRMSRRLAGPYKRDTSGGK